MVDVTQAHAELLKDTSIQFRFPADAPRPPTPPADLPGPGSLAGLGSSLFWIIVAVVVVVVLVVVVQAIRNRGAPGRKTQAALPPALPDTVAAVVPRLRPARRRRPGRPGRVWRGRPRPAAARHRRDRAALPPHPAAPRTPAATSPPSAPCRPGCAPPSPRSPVAPNAPSSRRCRSGRRIGRRRAPPMPACWTRRRRDPAGTDLLPVRGHRDGRRGRRLFRRLRRGARLFQRAQRVGWAAPMRCPARPWGSPGWPCWSAPPACLCWSAASRRWRAARTPRCWC